MERSSQEQALLTVANIFTKFVVVVAYAVSNTENLNMYFLINLLIHVFVYVYVYFLINVLIHVFVYVYVI